jgi:hypothetical protein
VLASLDMTLRTGADFSAVRDSIVRITLNVPTGKDYVAAACETMKQGTVGEFSIVGRVVQADGKFAGGARYDVRAQRDLIIRPFVNCRADEQGLFVICGAVRHDRQLLSAEHKHEFANASYDVERPLATIRLVLQPQTTAKKPQQ